MGKIIEERKLNMDKNLTPDDIAECITSLIARNKLWAGKKVYAYFLVKKTA